MVKITLIVLWFLNGTGELTEIWTPDEQFPSIQACEVFYKDLVKQYPAPSAVSVKHVCIDPIPRAEDLSDDVVLDS